MACDIVRMNGKSAKGVYFPFAKSSDEFDEQIKRKNFNRAPKEAIAILKSLRPYTGGNVVLRALHDMDILDKHDLLIPTYKIPVIPVDNAVIGSATISGCVFVGFDDRLPIEVLEEPGQAFGKSIPDERALGDGGCLIVFSNDVPMAGVPVIQALEDFCQAVKGIIESFSSLLSRS